MERKDGERKQGSGETERESVCVCVCVWVLIESMIESISIHKQRGIETHIWQLMKARIFDQLASMLGFR
jgi:hypothetical protein